MSLELVTLRTDDGIDLDGAWYFTPATIPSRPAAVLVVHGLTWNFYRGPSRWLPPLLAAAGYPCLALNMRDHDLGEVKDFALSHNDLAAGIADPPFKRGRPPAEGRSPDPTQARDGLTAR